MILTNCTIVSGHPIASLTANLYSPAGTPISMLLLLTKVPAELNQLYLYNGLPPETET